MEKDNMEKNYYENQIEVIARVFILQDGEVLLNKRKDVDHFFLPGGHVEYNEYIEEALGREMEEELGVEVEVSDFIGLTENIFKNDYDGAHHEINIVFTGKIKEKDVKCKEGHIEYCWIKMEDFAKTKVLPETLKNSILKWLDDRKNFRTKEKHQ